MRNDKNFKNDKSAQVKAYLEIKLSSIKLESFRYNEDDKIEKIMIETCEHIDYQFNYDISHLHNCHTLKVFYDPNEQILF